jgi:hypothetical protein
VTVGAVGGFTQGGGFGSLSCQYGTAVGNLDGHVLPAGPYHSGPHAVTVAGQHKVAEC